MMHRIVGASGVAYEWQDAANTGIQYPASEEFHLGTFPFSASHCSL
jgi:hypothetical protein